MSAAVKDKDSLDDDRTPDEDGQLKADEGHDENMSIEEVVNKVGAEQAKELEQRSIEVYSFAHQYAEERGIIIADTKMEFGFIDGK